MKKCTKCNLVKKLNEFYKCSKHKDGLAYACKLCKKTKDQKYYVKNKKKILKRIHEYALHNKHKITEKNAAYRRKNRDKLRQHQRQYYRNNKEYCQNYNKQYQQHPANKRKRLQYLKIRRNNDINYRLSISLRNRINKIIKRDQRAGSAIRDLGCPLEELKQWLEKQFRPNMSWGNYGASIGKWSIDHIKALSTFNLSDRKQFLEACNYKNLRPLWNSEQVALYHQEQKSLLFSGCSSK